MYAASADMAEHIFGAGGGQAMATQFDLPFLGSLPLTLRIREQTDAGTPTVQAAPDSDEAKRYRDIAIKMTANLSLAAKDYSSKMPPLKVQAT